jgi:hypothetical protein
LDIDFAREVSVRVNQPLSPQDQLAIMGLLAGMARALDSGDVEGYVNSFTADGVLFETYQGQAAIREYVSGIVQRRSAEGKRGLHFVGYPTLQPQDDHVRAYSYLLRGEMGAEPPVAVGAEYADECVKVDGGWRVRRRSYSVPWRKDG